MSETTPGPVTPTNAGGGAAESAKKKNVLLRVIIIAAAVVLAVIAYFIAVNVVPIEWARFIDRQSPGGYGVWLGLGYGTVLTLISLVVLWQATRSKVTWGYKGIILLVAVLISVPNLLTAGIAFGASNSAHQAQRILGVNATWFTLWTGIGAIVGVVLFILGFIGLKIWRRRSADAKAFRAQERIRKLEEKENQRARLAAEKAAPAPGQARGLNTSFPEDESGTR